LQSKKQTIAEYLAMEKIATEKHEYNNGEIVAMPGGTINHGRIIVNFSQQLSNILDSKELPCENMGNEIKVWIDQWNSFVYPDGMMICDEIETCDEDQHAVVNPVLIVEVLSKSTEGYDHGKKFQKYRSIPSFKEYILISQDKPIVEVYHRTDETTWSMVTTLGLDKSFFVHTLNAEIDMQKIYQRIKDLKGITEE